MADREDREASRHGGDSRHGGERARRDERERGGARDSDRDFRDRRERDRDRGMRDRPYDGPRPRDMRSGEGGGMGRPGPPGPPMQAVDREETCPMLVRLFLVVGKHHGPEAFGKG